MSFRFLRPTIALFAIALAACGRAPEPPAAETAAAPEPAAPPPAATVFDDTALGNDGDGRNWAAFGRTYSEQRFSPLDAINRETVGGLAVDWYLDLPNARGLVGTPLVADGVMYFNESMNRVHAVDLRTRERLWMYDPRVAENTEVTMK